MDGMNSSNGSGAIGKGSTLLLTIGWISAVLAIFVHPLLGLLGVVMGILSTKRGSRAGLPLIVTSIVLMGIGLIFGGVIINYTRHYLGI